MGQYDPKKPSKFNTVNIVLFFTLTIGGYLGWWYVPHWWPNWQLSGIMRSVANDAYREYDDEKLLKRLLKNSKRTGLKLRPDHFTIKRVPYSPSEMGALGVDSPEGIKLFEDRGKAIQIRVKYSVNSQWPLLDKRTKLNFDRTIEHDLRVIKY